MMIQTTEKLLKEKAIQMFGDDMKKWVFVCPCCKREQDVEKFVQLGLSEKQAMENVMQVCFSNYDKIIDCGYQSGGAFDIKFVFDGVGVKHAIFPFKDELH